VIGASLQQPSAWDQTVDALLDFTPSGAESVVRPTEIRDEQDLADYLVAKFGIVIPSTRCCTGHLPPWEAFCDAYFARSPVTVWKASRGFGGKSQTLALLGNVEAATLRADVNVLGGTGQQSERVLEAMDRFWKHPTAPRELLASEPAKKETRFVWGNVIRALMASTASVRGPHPQRLRMDEVDEMDLHILDAAMGQTMSKPAIPAQTVLSSTHHYPDHTMTEILRRAHDRGWPVYEWCWRETLEPHGWLPQSEVTRKRSRSPTPCGRRNTTSRSRRPTTARSSPKPSSGCSAATSGCSLALLASWCRSKGRSAARATRTVPTGRASRTTRRSSRCAPTCARCAWSPGSGSAACPGRRWSAYLEDRHRRIRRRALHDGTGLGDVIAGYLTRPATAFILVGRDRSGSVLGIRQRDRARRDRAPLISSLQSEHKFVTTKDLYEPSGHPPDGVVAGALAYRASRGGGSLVDTVTSASTS
jgi:hypothetical protein